MPRHIRSPLPRRVENPAKAMPAHYLGRIIYEACPNPIDFTAAVHVHFGLPADAYTADSERPRRSDVARGT